MQYDVRLIICNLFNVFRLFFMPSGYAGVRVPGVLAPFHWTVSSPVPGLDSRLRSVGGDTAGDEEEKEESEEEECNKRTKTETLEEQRKQQEIKRNKQERTGDRVSIYWLILTCDNTACDRGSLLMAVYDGLDAVGVLHSRSQARNVNTP